MKEILDWIIALVGGVCSWFFGGLDGFIYALIAFSVVDYITGVLAAGINHELSSEIGFKGIAKKITIFFLVGVAHVIDTQFLGHLDFLGNTALLRDVVIFFYVSDEGISILENADKMGIPLPEKLRSLLLQVRGHNNENNTKKDLP